MNASLQLIHDLLVDAARSIDSAQELLVTVLATVDRPSTVLYE